MVKKKSYQRGNLKNIGFSRYKDQHFIVVSLPRHFLTVDFFFRFNGFDVYRRVYI